jgi:beta-glucosidase
MRHNRILAISAASKSACQIVFFGGETVSCWDRFPALWKQEYGDRHALNFALWGSRPENMLWQVENGELDGMNPKLVVLQSQEGLRGSSAAPPETLVAGIAATAASVLRKVPGAKVLIVGASPYGAKPGDPQRLLGDRYNALLAKLADDKSIYFLDTTKAFLNADGTIGPAGLPGPENATEAVFGLWAAALRDEVAKLTQ